MAGRELPAAYCLTYAASFLAEVSVRIISFLLLHNAETILIGGIYLIL